MDALPVTSLRIEVQDDYILQVYATAVDASACAALRAKDNPIYGVIQNGCVYFPGCGDRCIRLTGVRSLKSEWEEIKIEVFTRVNRRDWVPIEDWSTLEAKGKQ